MNLGQISDADYGYRNDAPPFMESDEYEQPNKTGTSVKAANRESGQLIRLGHNDSPNIPSLLDQALGYVNQGLSIFPCSRDKKPLTPHGYKDATREPATIKQWWISNPDASIGMAVPETMIVLDIDLPDGPETLARLEAIHGALPATRKQRTGGGGIQYFFRLPEGATAKNSARKIGPGIDTRAAGGYVVLPPSGHPSGGVYRWITESERAVCPEWILDALRPTPVPRREAHQEIFADINHPYIRKAVDNELQDLLATPEGQRNDALNKAALKLGHFVGSGCLSEVEATGLLLDAATSIGLAQREAEATIRSGLAAGVGDPRGVPDDETPTKKTKTVNATEEAPISLPDDLPTVQSFDYDLLPDTLRPWIQDISERMQCPPDFVAVAALGAIAAVLGRKVGIRPQARTDWTVVPNLWIMVVGRPGVLKSPALEAGLAPLKRLIAEANNTHQAAEEQYKVEALTAKLKQEAAEKTARKMLAKDPEADLSTVFTVGEELVSPILKRYQANDCTPASLGELLRQNPNGLLVFRDEVVSLLKSLDRDGQDEGRGFYLTAWNGDSPYTFDRIGRGLNLTIPAICLSLLGGTQPGRLSEYIYHAVKGGAADDGLIQRFGIMVWPDIPKKWKNVDREPNQDAKNQAYQIFTHLDKLTPDDIQAERDTDVNGQSEGIPYLRFEPAALELFTEWRADLEAKLRSDDMLPALESHFSKYRKLVPSLALIFHLVDGGIGPVSETATLRALAWSQYLESHAYRAYGSISSPEISTAKAILKKIQSGKLSPDFGPTDVWRPGWSKLTDRDQVMKGLQLLEDYGWITAEEIPTKGRPKTVYHYNGDDNE